MSPETPKNSPKQSLKKAAKFLSIRGKMKEAEKKGGKLFKLLSKRVLGWDEDAPKNPNHSGKKPTVQPKIGVDVLDWEDDTPSAKKGKVPSKKTRPLGVDIEDKW